TTLFRSELRRVQRRLSRRLFRSLSTLTYNEKTTRPLRNHRRDRRRNQPHRTATETRLRLARAENSARPGRAGPRGNTRPWRLQPEDAPAKKRRIPRRTIIQRRKAPQRRFQRGEGSARQGDGAARPAMPALICP